jgi:hypothetical protein
LILHPTDKSSPRRSGGEPAADWYLGKIGVFLMHVRGVGHKEVDVAKVVFSTAVGVVLRLGNGRLFS